MSDYDELRERLNEDVKRANRDHPPSWTPQESGDCVVGELETVETDIPTDYGLQDVAIIRPEQQDRGELISVWLSHTVLEDQWNKADPSPGDIIGIAYLGKKEPEHGDKPYHNYSVRVNHGGDEPADDRLDHTTPVDENEQQPGEPLPF